MDRIINRRGFLKALSIGTAGLVLYPSTTYSQCSGSDPDRRRAFSRLTPEERSTIVREHLTYELEHRQLNGSQRAVINEGFEIASPELYSKHEDEKHRPFLKKIRLNFSAKEAQEIFETFPNYQPTELKKELTFLRDCDCSTWWTFCEVGGCGGGSGSCGEIVNCGPFWAFICNGYCSLYHPPNDIT